MAENKKSFVLYTDILHTVKKLSKEQAGELFIHILEYVNDEVTKPHENFVVDLVFEPIKQQLKRDLQEWTAKKERRAEAGRAGMASRWGQQQTPPLQPITENSNTTPVIAPITTDNNTMETIASITNITDSVNANANANANANVNGNVILSTTPSADRKKNINFDLSFLDYEKRELITIWLKYKKSRGESYKSIDSVKLFIRKLDELSANKIDIAKQLIEESMAQNYAGVHPLNGNKTTPTTSPSSKLDRNYDESIF